MVCATRKASNQPAHMNSLCYLLEYSLSVKLLTEHHLEFLSLKICYIGSSECTLVKIPHCWKSHVTPQLLNFMYARSEGLSEPSLLADGVSTEILCALVYSKTCVKQPLSNRQNFFFKKNYRLMQVKSIAECSKRRSILHYFWPLLSYHLSLRPLFSLFLSGHFTRVLL